MKTHRFIGDYNLNRKRIKLYDETVVNQIRKVLRLKPGHKILLCDGRGKEAVYKLIGFIRNGLELEIVEEVESDSGMQNDIILFCSILKKSNFELVVQKATEVGVSMMVPLRCKRTVKMNLKYERIIKIIKEASEQSGRTSVPEFEEILSFEDSLQYSKKIDSSFLFDESGEPYINYLKEETSGSTGLWIGPEGGWEETEINLAQENKIDIVSLCGNTLRAETAAIIASYLAISKELY